MEGGGVVPGSSEQAKALQGEGRECSKSLTVKKNFNTFTDQWEARAVRAECKTRSTEGEAAQCGREAARSLRTGAAASASCPSSPSSVLATGSSAKIT